jgi:hypothetical protein
MAEQKEGFRTSRGFLNGDEPDEENYFAYSATLRIFGEIPDIQEITKRLGVEPSHAHMRGDRQGINSPPYDHDMWSYSPDLPEENPLEEHINQLWAEIAPHKDYLQELKKTLTVDVFLGYRSNCDTAGISLPPESIRVFTELEVRFELSIIIA